MTEEEWLSSVSIDAMLDHLGDAGGDRKRRLFMVASAGERCRTDRTKR